MGSPAARARVTGPPTPRRRVGLTWRPTEPSGRLAMSPVLGRSKTRSPLEPLSGLPPMGPTTLMSLAVPVA